MQSKIVVSAGVVALVVSLGGASVAASAAQKAKTSGPEKVFVTPNDTTSAQHPGKIVMTGTIADYGSVVSTNAKGKPTAKATYRLLELKKGTILVNIAAFNKAITAAFPHATFDKATCSVSLTVKAPITFVSGTKAYAGITGSVTMTGNLAEISARTKSGACTMKTTTPALATYFGLMGSGTVTLP